MTKRRCRTWLGRCIRDASSSFKRLLKTPRLYRTVIYWSISNRTRPRTCVCARPSFQTTVFSTCICRRYKTTEYVDSLFIRTMSALVKRHIVCIQALNRIKSNKLKRAIIANADADLLCALAECSYNILKKNIPLTELQRRRLSTRVGSETNASCQEKTYLAATAGRRGTERRFPIGLPSTVGKFGLSTLAPRGAAQEVDTWNTHARWPWWTRDCWTRFVHPHHHPQPTP